MTTIKLCNYTTGNVIRTATEAEYYASLAAAEMDGGAGVIEVDGESCYVEGDVEVPELESVAAGLAVDHVDGVEADGGVAEPADKRLFCVDILRDALREYGLSPLLHERLRMEIGEQIALMTSAQEVA